jgi:hypothetical protein
LLAVTVPAQAADGVRFGEGIGFYVGVDSRVTIPTGTFAGMANPNAGRLTLLFDHGDHFHGIGAFSITGTAAAPVVTPTSTNNRIPEPYTVVSPATAAIPLAAAGTGLYAGHWVSSVLAAGQPTFDYSHLGIASIQTLNDVSAASDLLFHSSGNRYSANYQGVTVGLQLISATAGLMVGFGNNLNVFNSSATYVLGSSGSFQAMPTFYVADSAAAGMYSAQFRLVNLGTNANVTNSGNFFFDFAQPIPEPQTWAMLLAGLAVLGSLAHKRRRTS